MNYLFCFSVLSSFSMLTFLAPMNLQAATINLNVGESITIQPNSTTTVNCGGENATCTLPVKNLRAKFEYCEADNNNTVAECLDQIWPRFKASFSHCTSQGFDACLTFCKSSFETLDCLSICE